MSARLTPDQLQRLFERTYQILALADVASPDLGEDEPAYTGRVLLPLMQAKIRDTGIDGFAVVGDGHARKPNPVPALGVPFRPDLALRLYDEWLVAVEVKYLRRGAVQDSYAKGLGQSLVYHRYYPHSILFAIDYRPESATRKAEVTREAARLDLMGLGLVCRRASGGLLLPA